MRSPFLLKLSYALLTAWAAVITGGCAADLHRYAFSQVVMGVCADITVYSESEPVAANAVRGGAPPPMARLDDSLSDYRVDNELARVCRGAHPGPMAVSYVFGTILEQSLAIARATDGAFDPTVGPMVRLWGEARKQGRFPKGRSSPVHELGRDTRTSCSPGTTMGISRFLGCAGHATGLRWDRQGAAADEGLAAPRRQRHSRSLVAVAGDIAAGDPPPARDGWTIAVATRSTDTASEFVSIANAAISTSGDLSSLWRSVGSGIHTSSTLGPRRPVGGPIVSVIAPAGRLPMPWRRRFVRPAR